MLRNNCAVRHAKSLEKQTFVATPPCKHYPPPLSLLRVHRDHLRLLREHYPGRGFVALVGPRVYIGVTAESTRHVRRHGDRCMESGPDRIRCLSDFDDFGADVITPDLPRHLSAC